VYRIFEIKGLARLISRGNCMCSNQFKAESVNKIIAYVNKLDGSSVIGEKRCVKCNQRSPNLNGIILSRTVIYIQ